VADWSQLFSVGAIGAVAGGVLTWFGGVLRSGFDHLLDQRKRRREEAQTIRAEQREEARKRAERQQIESEAAKKDEAVLLMYKIQLKGATDLPTAGGVISGIHGFFIQRPQYLNAANRAFLEKYPGDFRDQVCYAPQRFPEATLDDLKQAVETLNVSHF
jgi:hypothetical protein